jgi:hypothetical protein
MATLIATVDGRNVYDFEVATLAHLTGPELRMRAFKISENVAAAEADGKDPIWARDALRITVAALNTRSA